ncbi:MAG: hypothetical protein JSV68_19885, partial [Anaerolineaceae bacterium]
GGDLLLFFRNLLYKFTFAKYSLPQPLLKDPIALLSSEWLAKRFHMKVVALIRHPAAFVYSLKRRQETFDFNWFLGQKWLMESWLYPFRDQLQRPPQYFEEQASLVWLCLNYVLDQYAQRNLDWILVRHEDIASSPHTSFRKLFQQLEIPYTWNVRRKVESFSRPSNPIEPESPTASSIKRDSQNLVKRWQVALSQEEISRIHQMTAAFAGKYYGPEDW